MKKRFPDHFRRLKSILEPGLDQIDIYQLGKYNFSYTKNKDNRFSYMVEAEWDYYEKISLI